MNYDKIDDNLYNANHCIELFKEVNWRGNREAILKDARQYLINVINEINKEL